LTDEAYPYFYLAFLLMQKTKLPLKIKLQNDNI